MTGTRRRTVLGLLAGAAVGGPAVLAPGLAAPALAADYYPSNTALYADPGRVEGTDYSRRYRRHGALDDDLTSNTPFPEVAVIAPHGGGIEPGTSELCLAVAGYHPATLAVTPSAGPVYDYWMFEGLLSSGNGVLHVTSTHCDDPYARAIVGGSRYAVSLHGCGEQDAGLPAGTQAVLVGGLDSTLKGLLLQKLGQAGIQVIDASSNGSIDGGDPANIVNRTLTGAGAQLELTTPLRNAMFGTNTRAQRKNTTLTPFWTFVNATRAAIALR